MQNTSTQITIDELKDLMSFKTWLRKVLNLDQTGPIPNQHLLIYLKYIERQVEAKEDKSTLPTWKKLIRDLRTRLQSFERVKNNES